MSQSSHIEQLLSAYLDGEVTEKERAEIEQWLQNDPTLDDQLTQWKELGGSLRSLSKHKLPSDFSNRVLKAIKETSDSHPVQPLLADCLAVADSDPNLSTATSEGRQPAYSRWNEGVRLGLVSVVSMAAGLLLALLLLPQLQDVNSQQMVSVPANEREFNFDPQPIAANDEQSSDFDSSNLIQIESGGEISYTIPPQYAYNSLGAKIESPIERNETVHQDREITMNQLYFVDFQSDDPPLAVVSEIFTRNEIEILSEPVSEIDDQMKLALDRQGQKGRLKENQPESSDQIDLNKLALNRLIEQSQDGIEAVYVVATHTQLQKAIEELSDKAEIAGFHLPPDLMRNLQPSTESKTISFPSEEIENYTPMERLIAEERRARRSFEVDGVGRFHLDRGMARIPSEGIQPGSRQNGLPSIESRSDKLQFGASLHAQSEKSVQSLESNSDPLNRMSASARQLRPIENAIAKGVGIPMSSLESNEESTVANSEDSKDLHTADELEFGEEKEESPPSNLLAPIGSSVESSENQGDEIVQFLLLIKTKTKSAKESQPSQTGSVENQ